MARLIALVTAQVSRVRPTLIALAMFMILLGLINTLVVNQKVVLYMFYLPVVIAGWLLPRRDSLGLAILATLMVVAYVFFIPHRISYDTPRLLLWTELMIWGGILIVTAYMVTTLKSRADKAVRNLEHAYSGVLAILSKFIQTVDADTEAHCSRVSLWAVRIAQRLRLGEARVEEVRIAGLLHDVGKAEVSVELLRKAAALSKTEQEHIREHASRGAAIVKPVGGMIAQIADTIEMHHERYDGSGHRRLAGEEILLTARIIAVADVFDALMSDRPYRKGLGISEALDKVIAGAGTHFDPAVVNALVRVVRVEGDAPVAAQQASLSETA